MQKHRILSMLLALAMILTMLPAAVFAEGETDALKEWSVTLGDNIGVNFYLGSADYTVTATVNGAAVTPSISGDVATVNVAAAQMNDTIVLTVKSGEETVHTGEYSVRQYADTILNGSYDEEVKAMVKQMLNYGAAAQTYFNYNTGALANSGITVTEATVPTDVPEVTVTDNLDGINLYGMSLMFQSKTAVRFYFTVEGNISDYTFSQGTPVEKNGMYYVEISGINPQDLDKAITVSVNDGAMTVTYSPLNYIVRKYNSAASSDTLKALVQAMYGYHLEALEYQKYLQIIQVGTLQQSSNTTPWVANENETFIDFNTVAYTATTGEYTSLTADAIKLVRGGEVYSVANPGQGLLVKESDTGHKLKLTPWGITGDHLPIQAHDYFIIEGRFESTSGDGTAIQIDRSYIYYDGTNVEVSATEPVLAIQLGTLQQSSNTAPWVANENETYIDFNTVAYTATTGEYTSLTADAIKLVRGGEVYSVANPGQGLLVKESDTGHKLKLTPWGITGDHLPIQAHDYFIIEGRFESTSGDGTAIQIDRSYIYYDGTNVEVSETEPILPTTVAGGMMNKVDGYGWTDGTGALIFKMDNTAPTGGYAPTSASNIKLIRDGETYDVGYVGVDVINKDNDGWYTLAFWTIVDYKPMLANDILVVEGDFYQSSTKTTLNISKTYVLLNADGTAEFSTEMPIIPTTVAGGMMNKVDGYGWTGSTGDLIFKMDNTAPTGGYAPTSASNIQLIRDGETYDVGYVGVDVINKDNDGWYTLAFWTIVDYKPMLANDILVVEGDFYQSSTKTTLNISKTYVLLNADGTAEFSTEMPIIPTTVAGGMMNKVDGYGWTGSTGDLIFKMDNTAPTGGYAPTSASNIQLIRDGETYDVGYVGVDVINKDNDGWYTLAFWTIVDYKPMLANDILVVEGDFYQSSTKTTLNISKTYILLNEDGSATFSATEPSLKTIVDVVELDSHSNGWDSSRFYFTAAENDAPYDSGWSLRYVPVSADAIKLVKDGVTTNVGNTGAETIVKYSTTDYTVESWAVGAANVAAGNMMIIEGLFYNAANDTYIKVEKTYFTFNADGTVTVLNDADKYIDAGTMGAYSSNWVNNGFYFAMASNALPYNAAQEDWSVEYAPTSTAAIKLIRDGVTTESARVGAGTMIKLADGQYYMKIENWTITSISSKDDLLDGDILVVEGDFVNASNGYTLHIDKSYITLSEGNVSFSTAADTEFGEVLLANSTDKLNIGMWNGSYHVFEDKQLKELQDAGITKIVGIDTQWIGTTDVNAWLDRVYSYGISVVFDLRGWDGVTVPSYASHPGVLGFLMWDEPCVTDFDTLADLKTKFDELMPAGKLFYVNLLASCVADSSLFGENYSTSQTDYDQYYVTEFLNKLDIEVLSWDNYSLISQADDTTAKGIRTDYFYNFEVMASKANDNMPLWYIMLSAGHTSGAENTIYNTPTAEELRWQMAVAMTYGVQNIDHFVYVSHESDFSSMVEYETWEPTDLYYDILTVDNEYLAWDNIFMAYDWVGVGKYSANTNDTMLDQLKNPLDWTQHGISSISASENLLVGVFDHNGDKAYMVTNAGSTSTSWFSGDVGDGREFNMADSTVTLTLDAADYKCVAVINNGEISYVAVENNTVTLDVEAYEGVFVIPVLN